MNDPTPVLSVGEDGPACLEQVLCRENVVELVLIGRAIEIDGKKQHGKR
jgi:hypothetical protein